VTDRTGRLRAVSPLLRQLTLDLPGFPPFTQLSAPAPRRGRPAAPGEPGTAAGGGLGAVPRLLPTRQVGDGRGVARVPVAVWAVCDGEDLVGVYAAENIARADTAWAAPVIRVLVLDVVVLVLGACYVDRMSRVDRGHRITAFGAPCHGRAGPASGAASSRWR